MTSTKQLKNDFCIDTPITSGRFSKNMTNEQWQLKFQKMKSTIPVLNKRKLSPSDAFSSNDLNATSSEECWTYCLFINDILDSIREGNMDYCYNTYHIYDLLRLESKRLKTYYNKQGGYMSVWLDGVCRYGKILQKS